MRTEFAAWYPPGDEDRRRFIETGMVVPDTNILLDLYRMKAEAREDVLALLATLEDRLWIPYQVGHEFHRNRLSVIFDQEQVDQKIRAAVKDSQAKLQEAIRAIRDHPAIDKATLGRIADDSFARVIEYLDSVGSIPFLQMKESVQGDPVLDAVTTLFEKKVGQPYTQEQLAKVRAEAKRRIDQKIPPGYLDAKKDEDRAAGDYLVWRQTLDEATKRKMPVLFITNDQKEDWYRKVHGLTIGPRVELIEEMAKEAGVTFHAQTLARFLETAQSASGATVKDVTVSEVKRLDEIERDPGANIDRSFEPSDDLAGTGTAEVVFPLFHRRPPLGVGLGRDNLEAATRIRQRAELIQAEQEVLQAQLLQHQHEGPGDFDPRSHRRALEERYQANLQLLRELDSQLADLATQRMSR
ncbi:PIN domain-containing protein [Dactylosporangium sp. NPDC005572]|uniref:PIN-like domain-containing protein n=1 Tax=Dactylosporangium sp. NPDC005572 TaxID=3156889 RepID=UPI00339F4D55